MPSATIVKRHFKIIVALLFISVLSSCVHEYEERERRAEFEPVIGINYLEVRRAFPSGLSFHNSGYQLSPLWKLKFLSNKFAMVYSPDKNAMLKFPVTRDHDSLVNVANTWLKPMKITKDSLVLQVLSVEAKKVYFDKSIVYMTLYSDEYLQKKGLNIEELKKPNRADTLFIQKRAAMVNAGIDSGFAGTQTVIFKSLHPKVSVVKTEVHANLMNKLDASEAYMYPEYNIRIKNAYKNFAYSFWALVDVHGEIHYTQSVNYILPEFKESTIKTINSIIQGYMKEYLQVTPGKTLGIPHNSFVLLNISGKEN